MWQAFAQHLPHAGSDRGTGSREQGTTAPTLTKLSKGSEDGSLESNHLHNSHFDKWVGGWCESIEP